MTNIQHRRRAGYTLIELLVVIAIIAVLMSLTTAAVMRVLVKGPEITCRSEIDGLATARAAFLADFDGVSHMPSRILLREDGNYTAGDQLTRDSKVFLEQMFGRRFSASVPRDWNGNGTVDPPVVLTGDQCLVFFLGGIPNGSGPPGCLGFSADPSNPTAPGAPRRGPFFEFKSNRLVAGAGGFYSYKDPFNKNQFYAYFNAGKVTGDYLRYGKLLNPLTGTQLGSDCPSIPQGPYFQPSGQFYNPNGFQIISAGADGKFGSGGLLDPNVGSTDQNGRDDFANFSRSRLGATIQ
jgi:general secretion pathway protein G